MNERRLLLGITGGIAAYKTPYLIRLFRNEGVLVKTVVTPNALQFVTRVTLESLGGAPVACDMFEKNEHDYEHLELARWAQVMVVAPATANTLAKFAGGVADNLLSTIFVARKCPVVLAPAMNDNMMADHTVARNLKILRENGCAVCEPGTGALACGSTGPGRMAEPEIIFEKAMLCFRERSVLEGRRVLVTAGATRERLDPVRFITNRSTGRMGYAVAEAFLKYGAEVTLISGPSALYPPPGARFVQVESAREMHDAVMEVCDSQDVIVKAAAVADYTPERTEENKIKKGDGDLVLTLKRTADILGALGARKKKGQVLVGFSAETRDHLENSVAKLKKKNLDMIVLNDVAAADAGFGVDTNRVMFITAAGKAEAGPGKGKIMIRETGGMRVACEATPLMSKHRVAEALVGKIMEMMEAGD